MFVRLGFSIFIFGPKILDIPCWRRTGFCVPFYCALCLGSGTVYISHGYRTYPMDIAICQIPVFHVLWALKVCYTFRITFQKVFGVKTFPLDIFCIMDVLLLLYNGFWNIAVGGTWRPRPDTHVIHFLQNWDIGYSGIPSWICLPQLQKSRIFMVFIN